MIMMIAVLRAWGSKAPWMSDFKNLDEDKEIKMDEPTQYLKDNFASIVGLLRNYQALLVSWKLQCCRLLLKVVGKGIVHYACI